MLAAGKGARMGSDLPKVLLPLCGRPMLAHILDLLAEAGVPHPVIVVGKNRNPIEEAFGSAYRYVVQEEQLGSGHAVMCAVDEARGSANVLVMCGDSPLFRAKTIRELMEKHVREHATVTLVSAVLEDPQGYGRIARSASGEITGIVEEKMATPEQRAIREINGGAYAFDADWLRDNLGLMRRNEAGEYCLTEMVDIALSQGRRVLAVSASPEEVAGVNTPDQLSQAEEILRCRD